MVVSAQRKREAEQLAQKRRREALVVVPLPVDQGGEASDLVRCRDNRRLRMNVGELKKVLEGVPDETPVGISDHYGDMEDLNGAQYYASGTHWREKRAWVQLDVPYIGEEPD